MEDNAAEIVGRVIRQRKTEKVLGIVGERSTLPAEREAAHRRAVLDSLETAGWAPFHYPSQPGGVIEPWRAHVVWPERLDALAVFLRDELAVTTKEPSLVAGCDALVLATWLPEFGDAEAAAASDLPVDRRRARDEEHLAAASAMVQNLLLMLTAHGMGTYWSSGGALRGPEAFAHLGVPAGERLLAAVFVEYPGTDTASKQRKPGALRDKRSTDWIREVGES